MIKIFVTHTRRYTRLKDGFFFFILMTSLGKSLNEELMTSIINLPSTQEGRFVAIVRETNKRNQLNDG